MTERIPIADVRKHLASVMRRCASGTRIKVTRFDRTVAVLVPPGDLRSLQDRDAEAGGADSGRLSRQSNDHRRSRLGG